MYMYIHTDLSVCFYTVYLPTTIKSFLGLGFHDLGRGKVFYDELTISSLSGGEMLVSHCLLCKKKKKGTTVLLLKQFL